MKRQEVELKQIQTYKIYGCSKLKYRELQLLLRIEPKTSKVRGRVKPHDRARIARNSTNFFPACSGSCFVVRDCQLFIQRLHVTVIQQSRLNICEFKVQKCTLININQNNVKLVSRAYVLLSKVSMKSVCTVSRK
ncbi:Hypothetical_protein [Hexamita inflata]|uniref:Hypothetical_protein n=1 Tax=Hexamita inflata TaxID=28002 RepID=A0AA86TIJ7_9EUKA|nr:Hypothetical protein HINF_LOCUS6196 [Hexamita inflata]CAI9918580.1 Hypothetical protein HINF_LOCUS6225 [Hexamita inflata]